MDRWLATRAIKVVASEVDIPVVVVPAGKWALAISLLTIAVLLSGCGNSNATTATETTSPSQPSAQATPVASNSCTVYDRGTALSVTFSADDANSACQRWIQARGQKGEFWSLAGQSNESQSMACIFRDTSDATAEIDDGGSQFLAEPFCSGFAGSAGWTEDLAAEQAYTARIQAAQHAQQQAQQQNDAVTGAGSALSSELARLQGDVSTLAGDSLVSDVSTLHSDLATVEQDLKTVESDPNDYVCSDASSVQDDENSIQDDLNSMNDDINSFTTDISNTSTDVTNTVAAERQYVSAARRYQLDSPDAPTSAQVTGVMAAATKATRMLRRGFVTARSQAAALLRTGATYVAQAHAACRAAGG